MAGDAQALRAGPLAGVRVVELAGIGPGPMCAMLLADLGATVIRIDRKQPAELGIKRPLRFNLLLRNRPVIALDLKDPAGVEAALQLIERADALIEGFRPGVTERMGLGPETCLARNPRLAYGRMTGWGQDGPLAQTAGHDVNYIAITGVLNAIGRADQPPSIPLNLVGDYAGGSLYLAMGLLAAILSARTTGRGQVVDAAIVDGTANLATTFFGMFAAGLEGSRDAGPAQHRFGDLLLADLLAELVVGELVAGGATGLEGVPEHDDHHEDDHPENEGAECRVQRSLASSRNRVAGGLSCEASRPGREGFPSARRRPSDRNRRGGPPGAA